MRLILTSMVTAIALLGGAAVAWAETSTPSTESGTSESATTLEHSSTSSLVSATPLALTPALPEVPTTTVSIPESALVTTAAVTAAARVSTQITAQTRLARQIKMAKKPWGARMVAKTIAKNKFKWGATQFVCLNKLWTAESGWRYRASNSRTAAYGIPQAHPGSKMSSVARDWRTNPVTQIRWGLKYIDSRYNTPCTAWSKFKRSNWY